MNIINAPSDNDHFNPTDYKEIFEQRGDSYSQAMGLEPGARAKEFTTLIELLELQANEKLLDIPSGGGYLKPYVDEYDLDIYSVDPANMFLSHNPEKKQYLSDITATPFDNNFFDKVYSLAGSHHLSNTQLFYNEVNRVLKPDGIFAYADVAKDTSADAFLNIFVDKYNSMGHKGDFLDSTICKMQLANAGLETIDSRLMTYYWTFKTEKRAIDFIRNLFGLDLASDCQIRKGIETYLNVVSGTGHYDIEWQLLQFKAKAKK